MTAGEPLALAATGSAAGSGGPGPGHLYPWAAADPCAWGVSEMVDVGVADLAARVRQA